MPPPREDELPKAHRIFVGRAAELRALETAAFAIPADRAILRVIYGPGGQGKTALCREMMRRTDADPSYGFLRRAVLDLHGRPKTDPDLLLVWIRNEFAKAGLFMPCFDLALSLAWERLRGEEPFPTLAKPWLGRTTETGKSAVGEGASDAAKWLKSDDASALLGEAVGDIPFVGFLLKRYGVKAIDRSKRAYLEWTRAPLQRLKGEDGGLKPPHELSALLPWMLAQDLNHHLAANPTERLVLLVDEYERVFDQGGAGTRWGENRFDRHMRELIQEANGLLAVFFSRERLPWEKDPDWRADLDGNQYLLGGLTDSDAEVFLSAVPIDDAAIRQAIIEGARERADPNALVYPLMLALQVEHWRVLTARDQVVPDRFSVQAETFERRCIELIERVLRDYGEPIQRTVEHLSVAQRFDRAAFEHVVQTFGTGLSLASFDHIAELSFVTRAPDDFLSLHNVIAAAIRERLDPERRAASVDTLFRHFLERARVERHSDLTEAHVLALFEAALLRRHQGIEGYVDWLIAMSEPLRVAARYSQATILWRESISYVEEALGTEHSATAVSYNNLAFLLYSQGDYAGARPLFERALAIREKTLGTDHPDTAISLNNLGILLVALGDRAGAKPMYERALAINETALGAEHPHTATTLNNFALLLYAEGNYFHAKILHQFALAIREKTLGLEHPDTAMSLNNLASLLNAQGDHAGAKILHERALAIRKKNLGADHPDTAMSLSNLAFVLVAQGNYADARPLYESAVVICEKALGPNHPTTVTIRANLDSLLAKLTPPSAAPTAPPNPE